MEAESEIAGPSGRQWVDPNPQQAVFPFVAEMPVESGGLPSLVEALKVIPEHRRPRGFKAHQPPVPLIPSLLLLLAAVMCGQRGYGGIAQWGRVCITDYPEVLDGLGFPRNRVPRTPAAATFFRLLRDMHLRQFQDALQGWLEEVAKALQVALPEWEKVAIPEDQIGVDGKTIRGASAQREREGQGVLHLVAAYAPALNVVLDQVATEGRGRELAAVKLLLGQLPLKDRVITADALATQREVCTTILESGGDYLLPVKENQPTLLEDIQEAFSPSGTS